MRRLTREQKELALKLSEKGVGFEEMVRKLEIAFTSKEEEIIRMLEEFKTRTDIQETLNVSQYVLYEFVNRLKMLGLPSLNIKTDEEKLNYKSNIDFESMRLKEKTKKVDKNKENKIKTKNKKVEKSDNLKEAPKSKKPKTIEYEIEKPIREELKKVKQSEDIILKVKASLLSGISNKELKEVLPLVEEAVKQRNERPKDLVLLADIYARLENKIKLIQTLNVIHSKGTNMELMNFKEREEKLVMKAFVTDVISEYKLGNKPDEIESTLRSRIPSRINIRYTKYIYSVINYYKEQKNRSNRDLEI